MKTSRRAFFLAFLLIPILLADARTKQEAPAGKKDFLAFVGTYTAKNAKQRDLRVSL